MNQILKKLGNKSNSVIKKIKILNSIDAFFEKISNKVTRKEFSYSPRDLRRYKTFIGNKLITKGKLDLIQKNLPTAISNGNRIFDLGCADGSLLCELNAFNNNLFLFGADSGYRNCFKGDMPKNINIIDLDLMHSFYNPKGKNNPETVDLEMPANIDLCIMYDVMPYLTIKTIENYFSQFKKSLSKEGLIFITCRIDTLGNFIISGNRGEKFQSSLLLSKILDIASRNGFEVVNLKWGSWDITRKFSTVYGADIIVFKKFIQ